MEDDKLNQLAATIDLNLLEKILDINSIDHEWTYSINKKEPFEKLIKLGKYYEFDEAVKRISVITQTSETRGSSAIKDRYYYYTYAASDPEQLFHILERSLQLQSFL